MIYKEYLNTKILILYFIRVNDGLHGYDITSLISQQNINISYQQVYKLLRVMKKDGWLNVEEQVINGKPNRIIYSLTQLGENKFKNLPVDYVSCITPFNLACIIEDERFICDALIWLDKQKEILKYKVKDKKSRIYISNFAIIELMKSSLLVMVK